VKRQHHKVTRTYKNKDNKLKTQLLCTFAHRNDLNIITDYIQSKYEIPERRIFAFSNEQRQNDLYCTYNADSYGNRGANTISIHRKKETNTLYTVNAMNEVIRSQNNGILDKSFILPWEQFANSFILTDEDSGYRVIKLKFFRKITW
jgi:hypothetical protein